MGSRGERGGRGQGVRLATFNSQTDILHSIRDRLNQRSCTALRGIGSPAAKDSTKITISG